MKQIPGRELCRHVVESFDDIGRALVDHTGGEECRIDHVFMASPPDPGRQGRRKKLHADVIAMIKRQRHHGCR
jgi:hypothetical protein